jgi:hypothetical protein
MPIVADRAGRCGEGQLMHSGWEGPQALMERESTFELQVRKEGAELVGSEMKVGHNGVECAVEVLRVLRAKAVE